MINKEDLQEIIDQIAKHTDGREKVSIMVETDEDEALMIGTASAYLCLAKVLLECLATSDSVETRGISVGEASLDCITSIACAFDASAHVVPSCLCNAESPTDSQLAVQHFNQD